MATRKIAPALAAGCTTILKPASESPLTALMMMELFEEAGVPADVAKWTTVLPLDDDAEDSFRIHITLGPDL